MNSRRSLLVGCGAYLPERILENSELAKIVDTSDDWIVKRTGIKQRHIAAEGELTSDLATKAAHDALIKANIACPDTLPEKIDLFSPRYTTSFRIPVLRCNLGHLDL